MFLGPARPWQPRAHPHPEIWDGSVQPQCAPALPAHPEQNPHSSPGLGPWAHPVLGLPPWGGGCISDGCPMVGRGRPPRCQGSNSISAPPAPPAPGRCPSSCPAGLTLPEEPGHRELPALPARGPRSCPAPELSHPAQPPRDSPATAGTQPRRWRWRWLRTRGCLLPGAGAPFLLRCGWCRATGRAWAG